MACVGSAARAGAIERLMTALADVFRLRGLPVALPAEVARAIETAAHLVLLDAAGSCCHLPGLALPGCECRLA